MSNLFSTTSASALSYAATTPAEPAPPFIATPYVAPAMSEYAAIGTSRDTYISGGGADDGEGLFPAYTAPPSGEFGQFSTQAAPEIAPLFGVDRLPHADMVAHGPPILGTEQGERLEGTEEAEAIAGFEGGDFLYGRGGDDLLNGGDGSDVLVGGRGNDDLYGGDGDDVFDYPIFDASGYAASGADRMYGGDGDDVYYVDDAGDKVVEYEGYGSDTVVTSLGEYTLDANVEKLVSENGADFHGIGNALDNIITSLGGNDTLEGGVGNDRLEAGGGEDTLIGGEGHDIMIGGAGADIFRIGDGDIGIDTIKDFNARDGDRLDFSGMSGADSFDDLSITMTATGAIVSYGESAVVLEGVTAASLTADMFIFG